MTLLLRRNLLVVFVAGLWLSSCAKKEYKGKFINNEKWGGGIYRYPNATPLEIRETKFNNLDDTTIETTGRIFQITTTRYDDSGYVVFRKDLSINDSGSSHYSEVFITYN